MGVTAEHVAWRYGITRARQDALAAQSHWRAGRAIAEGRFASQIVPVMRRTKAGEEPFITDEHVRAQTTVDELAKLKPVFERESGTVTAGNASGINDAAVAVLLDGVRRRARVRA